jgi:SAM-dependent methyltransferase
LGYSQNRFDWFFGFPKSMKDRAFDLVVDFGCGSIPRNPLGGKKLIGADLAKNAPFQTSDAIEYRQITPGSSLPFDDNSLDAITGFDVIEHLPRQSSGAEGNAFIDTMNEFYRALKPGGILLAVTPCYPSFAAFMDPTHVNFITPGTHKYFSDDNFAKSLGYGFSGEFKTLSAGWYPWAGSWLLDSTVNVLSSSNLKGRFAERPKRLTFFSYALRLRQLVFFSVFKIARTHFIWVLEKV